MYIINKWNWLEKGKIIKIKIDNINAITPPNLLGLDRGIG